VNIVETSAAEPETPENRKGSGLFQKGKSGNPGGRPKVEGEIRELAQKHGAAAIKRLVQLMRSKNERVAVTACQAILDRGFGKPPQALTGPNGDALQAPIFNLGWDDGGPGCMPIDPIEASRVYQQLMHGTRDAIQSRSRPDTSPKNHE
jgi:hypothetical protein